MGKTNDIKQNKIYQIEIIKIIKINILI